MSEKPYPYETHLDVKFPQGTRFDVPALLNTVTHPWYNQTLCQVNDSVRFGWASR